MQKHFENICQQFCDSELCATVFSKLVTQYEKPQRYYHTFCGHINSCVTELEKASTIFQFDKQIVTMAILMHDVVMDFTRRDNEKQSAIFAATLCKEIGISQEFESEVIHCILATKHTSIPKDLSARVVVDIDLTILGENEMIFDTYERNIRKEYLFVPYEIFKEKRIKALARFLSRPSIFLTSYFQEKYESQAQKNLIQSITQISQ